MIFKQVAEQLLEIDRQPSILLEKGQEKDKIVEFMKIWYRLLSSEQEGECSYVWSLVNGWEIDQLTQLMVTNPPPANSEVFKRQVPNRISEIDLKSNEKSGYNTVQYISKHQMLIRFEKNIIWINPSSDRLEAEDHTLMAVITSANIQNLLSFIQLKRRFSGIRLITIESIYRKLKKLVAFISTILHPDQNYEVNLQEPCTYLLKPQQHFEYAHIVWLIRQNCWFQSSYDLSITFNHTKQAFLIESSKIDETKLIYYGWKKCLISQQNYQKYIRQWDKSIIRATEQKLIHLMAQIQKSTKRGKNEWYLQFIKKELISELTSEEQDELFACCEMMELIPNQIIAKANYLFDYLYILLEGEFEVRQCNEQPGIKRANLSTFYGLSELKKREQTYSLTLSSLSKGTIFRIQKNNVLFHLYDLLN